MNKLSVELYVNILEYLDPADQFEWGSCCRSWHREVLKDHIRIVRVHFSKWLSEERLEELASTIPRMIKNPFKQLEVYLCYSIQARHISRFLEANRSIRKLEGGFNTINECCLINSRNGNEPKRYEDKRIIPSICVGSLSVQKLGSATFPDVPVRELNILYGSCSQPFQSYSFLSTLHKLSLRNCAISDVSMFGFIPDLTLQECENITDISALNNNRKIVIMDCDGIKDYSKSFEHSQVIDIDITCDDLLSLSFTHWKRVKVFRLSCSDCDHLPGNIPLPCTVFQCELWGNIINHINLCISSQHKLRELKIHEAGNLILLENLGWERLVVIEINGLGQLSSLQGLGCSKNQRIKISHCPLIKDYSPLQFVPEVEIWCTQGTVNLDELDHVKRLTIHARELISDPVKPYPHLQYLKIRQTKLSSFAPVAMIPSVTLDHCYFEDFSTFIEAGRKLKNQRIDFSLPNNDLSRFHDLYQRWLISEFTLCEKVVSPVYSLLITLLRR